MNKKIVHVLALLLLVVSAAAAAEQNEFDEIVAAIRDGDRLIAEGQDRQAIAQYQLAQRKLLQFRQVYADWDRQIVSFRLKYLEEKLENWHDDGRASGDSSSDSPADALRRRVDYLERANQQYQQQLKQLHAENSRLNTRLREALAIRPAAQEPAVVADTQQRLRNAESELTSARERISMLEKELAEYPEPEQALRNADLLLETRKNLNRVIAEAEELRTVNETLRQGMATAGSDTESSDENLHRSIVAVQAAQQLAETETEALRLENQRLHTRLDELEAQLGRLGSTQDQGSSGAVSVVDTARLALSQGEYGKASELLSAALRERPNDVELLYLSGRTLSLLGQSADAEVRIRRVLDLSPDSAVAHFELARLYQAEDSGNSGLARWHYHKALNLGFPRKLDFEERIGWEQR